LTHSNQDAYIIYTVANKKVANNITAEELAAKAVNETSNVSFLLEGLSAKDSFKLRCAKALNLISANHPELLYHHFDFFGSLLESPHRILKWNAIFILSNLAIKDTERKFDLIFDRYYKHLWDGDLITAANIVGASGKMAATRPDLRNRITSELLKVDVIPLPTNECREIARGKALAAFAEYKAYLDGDQHVIEFIRRCLLSTRPATRKKAERLLKKAADA
jgi:hypothetical protein